MNQVDNTGMSITYKFLGQSVLNGYLALIVLLLLFCDYFYDYSHHRITSMPLFLFAVTVTMSNDYVQNFITSFGNLLLRAISAYISMTDKSTVKPAYSLTIIQDCTFSPIYLLSLFFVWNL